MKAVQWVARARRNAVRRLDGSLDSVVEILRDQRHWHGWRQANHLEEALSRVWGLGCDRNGAGYRRRLQRLCTFLRELEPAGETGETQESYYQSLQRSLKRERETRPGAQEANLSRLRDLRDSLRALEPTPNESPVVRLWRLRAWQQGNRHRGDHVARSLRALRVLPVESHLNAMWVLLGQLEEAHASQARIEAARKRWEERFEECLDDWRWAYLQVLVRLARECLKEEPISPRCCVLAGEAEASLATAIQALEKRSFSQPRAQGLYGLLSQAVLHHATVPEEHPRDEKERSDLIARALVFARKAVEDAPESAHERLVLLEVLAHVGDSREMEDQAEIARNLDSGPQTLKAIGQSFWNRVATVRGKGRRRRILRQAASFFESAVQQVESLRFDGSMPLEQMRSHGWAHYWLGRFQCERGLYNEARGHLETASSLGFHPLQSKVDLAWACLLDRDRQQADAAFDAVIDTIRRLRELGPPPLRLAGEQRTIPDLELDARIGCALLCADWDPDRALRNAAAAADIVPLVRDREKGDLLASVHEARGRAYLGKGDLDQAVGELESAVSMSVGGGAPCYLGLAQAARAEKGGPGAAEALQRAQKAYRMARESDARGRYRREIWGLRRRLRKLEKPTGGPAAPPAPPAAPAVKP